MSEALSHSHLEGGYRSKIGPLLNGGRRLRITAPFAPETVQQTLHELYQLQQAMNEQLARLEALLYAQGDNAPRMPVPSVADAGDELSAQTSICLMQ